MKRYREVLNEFVESHLAETTQSDAAAQQQVLLEHLRQVMQQDTKYFNLCFGAVLLLFLGALVLVLCNLSHPERVTAIFGAAGISIGPLVKQMFGYRKEKSHSEAAYILATKLPPADLKSILVILLQGNK